VYCGSFKVKKNGKHSGKQTYKCKSCSKSFQNLSRKKRKIKILWKEYARHKQTYSELGNKYALSKPTIQKLLDQYNTETLIQEPREIILVIDTMYFKRSFGLMVFRDVIQKENLLWRYVEYETVYLYKEGVRELKDMGFTILGITTDGRRGIFKAFGDIPMQMCHFHQKQIVIRYISNKPKLEAGIELKQIVSRLAITDKESFEGWLNEWFEKWREFLNEKTEDPLTGRKTFTHRRLRSAYNSLKSHIPYLFTYLKYRRLGMPNTTNSLDGTFSHLRTKIRAHSGLKVYRKIKLVNELLTKK
jgi:hypothetical protein